METIAKYGMNGKTDENGKVTYDIKTGPMVGAPDDYISISELMERIDPEVYRRHTERVAEALRKEDMSLWMKEFRFVMDWTKWAYREKKDKISEIKDEYLSWKKDMQETKVKKSYNANLTDMRSFMDSIIMQNESTNNAYLLKSLKDFSDILQGKDKKQ